MAPLIFNDSVKFIQSHALLHIDNHRAQKSSQQHYGVAPNFNFKSSVSTDRICSNSFVRLYLIWYIRLEQLWTSFITTSSGIILINNNCTTWKSLENHHYAEIITHVAHLYLPVKFASRSTVPTYARNTSHLTVEWSYGTKSPLRGSITHQRGS